MIHENENTPIEEVKNDTTDNTEPVEKVETNTSHNDVEKLQAELAESKDKYLRLYAEFENFRRRTAKEKLDLINTAAEKVLTALLPIVDDFERSLKSIQQTIDKENPTDEEITAVKDGVALIFNKLTRILEQQGLKAMESAIGKPFDIDKQESVTQIPAPTEEQKGKVIDELEKGYLLNEKIIRFAKVVVGS
jgi:molecular chaperone GrpE